MSRKEFLAELERLLQDLPEEERKSAVQYYMDYFADAGEENEEKVIRELGSPEKAAESIKADYFGTHFNEEEFEKKNFMEKRAGQNERTEKGGRKTDYDKTGMNNRTKLLLILLAAIVLWPITLGIGGAVLGIAAAVVFFFAGLVIAAAGVMISGIIIIAAGMALWIILPAALVVIGTGILIFAIGMAATVISVKLCIIVYPAMFRGFINLCRRPFYGKAVS